MNRTVFWAIVLTWLVVSFVPVVSAANLVKMARGRGQGS